MNRPEDHIDEPIRERPLNPEPVQADPQLQLSEGRASVLQIAAVAFACVMIVGITVYGLGRPSATDGDIMASSPPAQETTGAAAPTEPAADPAAPQTGASVPDGENVAPAGEMPQQIPATEPVPHQVKPGVVESDSAR